MVTLVSWLKSCTKVHARVREIYSEVNEQESEAIASLIRLVKHIYAPGDRVWLLIPPRPYENRKSS